MSTASQFRPGLGTIVLVSLLSSLAFDLFKSVALVTVASAWRSGGGQQSFEVTEALVGLSAGRRHLLQVPTSMLSYNAVTKELTITAKAIKLVSTAGGRVTVAQNVTLSTAAGGSVIIAPSAQPIKFAAVAGNSVEITKDGNIIRFMRSGDVRGLQLFGADTASLFTRSSSKPTSGINIQTAAGALGDKGAVTIAPGGRQLRVSQGSGQNIIIADKSGNYISFDGYTTSPSLKLFGRTATGLYTLINSADSRIELKTAAGAFGDKGAIFLAPGGRTLRVGQGNTQNIDVSDINGNNIRFQPNNLNIYGSDTVCLFGATTNQCIA